MLFDPATPFPTLAEPLIRLPSERQLLVEKGTNWLMDELVQKGGSSAWPIYTNLVRFLKQLSDLPDGEQFAFPFSQTETWVMATSLLHHLRTQLGDHMVVYELEANFLDRKARICELWLRNSSVTPGSRELIHDKVQEVFHVGSLDEAAHLYGTSAMAYFLAINAMFEVAKSFSETDPRRGYSCLLFDQLAAKQLDMTERSMLALLAVRMEAEDQTLHFSSSFMGTILPELVRFPHLRGTILGDEIHAIAYSVIRHVSIARLNGSDSAVEIFTQISSVAAIVGEYAAARKALLIATRHARGDIPWMLRTVAEFINRLDLPTNA